MTREHLSSGLMALLPALLLLVGVLFVPHDNLPHDNLPPVCPPRSTAVSKALLTSQTLRAAPTRNLKKTISMPPLPPDDAQSIAAWLCRVDALSPRVTAKLLCRSAGGKEVFGVLAGANARFDSPSPTIAIICRQHGDEPAPTAAALELIASVATTTLPSRCALLSKVRFFIVPMLNPDGAAENYRYASDGINPNRDWGVFQLLETHVVANCLRRLRPELLLDCHELLPGDYKTHPYMECFGMAELPARVLATAAPEQGASLEIRAPARDCPDTLLYKYFQETYRRPAILLESSTVGKRSFHARVGIHVRTAWNAADWFCRKVRPTPVQSAHNALRSTRSRSVQGVQCASLDSRETHGKVVLMSK